MYRWKQPHRVLTLIPGLILVMGLASQISASGLTLYQGGQQIQAQRIK